MIKRLRNYILNENTYLSLFLFILYYSFKKGPKKSIIMAIDYRWFDLWNKTDTSITETSAKNYVVRIKSDNIQHAGPQTGDKLTRFYSAMSAIKRHMKINNSNVVDLTFIDYGCGKGRVLMLASKYGFNKVIGVELSSSMIDVARNNFAKINISNVSLIEEDAVDYKIPDANGYIFYFYNPFGMGVMKKVLTNIEADSQHSKNVFIVYSNPVFEELFDKKEYSIIHNKHKLRVYKLNSHTI